MKDIYNRLLISDEFTTDIDVDVDGFMVKMLSLSIRLVKTMDHGQQRVGKLRALAKNK